MSSSQPTYYSQDGPDPIMLVGSRKRSLPSSKTAKRTRGAAKKSTPKLALNRTLVVQRYPFPYRLQNTLKYYEVITNTTNGIGFCYNVFSANGLYDPNVSGAGHQPMYFDQLTAIYNHYHVMASKIKVTPDRTATADNGIQYAICLDDDATINATSMATFAERTGSIVWTACPDQGVFPTRTKYFNAKSVFGGDIIDNTSLKGSESSNPTEGQFYIVAIEGPASAGMTFIVEMEFTVVWSELKSISGS